MMPHRGAQTSVTRIAPPFSTLPVVPAPAKTENAQRAALTTSDGRPITNGTIELLRTATTWSATLRNMDRPGVVASAYFADGVRDVEVSFEDGRRCRARITGTSFIATSERVCFLTGIEPIR